MNGARIIRGWLAAALVSLAGASAAVAPGDDAEAVRRELGDPSGRMDLGEGREMWSYDRGRVSFLNGTVVRADLITPSQLQARRASEAADARRRAAFDARRAQALRAEGEAELRRIEADPDFLLAAPEWQLDCWRTFAERYPGVCITQQVSAAIARVLAAREASGKDARLQDLEFRVWSAEQKAAAAEAHAAERVVYPAYSYWPDGRWTYRVAPWVVAPGSWPAGSMHGGAGPAMGGTVQGGVIIGGSGSGVPGMAAPSAPGSSAVPYVRPGSWPYNFSRGMSAPAKAAKPAGRK